MAERARAPVVLRKTYRRPILIRIYVASKLRSRGSAPYFCDECTWFQRVREENYARSRRRESETATELSNRRNHGSVSYLGFAVRMRGGDLDLDLFVILAVFLVTIVVLFAITVSGIVAGVLLCNTRIVRGLC